VVRLFNSAGVVGNTDGTEAILKTYTMPGGTLGAANDGVRITAFGNSGNGLVTYAMRIYFGGWVFLFTGSGVLSAWKMVVDIYRLTATTQVGALVGVYLGSTALAQHATPAETLANQVTIKVTGQNTTDATAGVANCSQMLVEKIPA